ncbi:MAG: YifB family Mg chelatase-like AAA ATPase [Eubacterium sp.]|nr:YifB family Mg chelatase-like AAA ATPase [Eubacterium sp.]
MYSIVSTAIIRGVNSLPVQVEADVSDGMPMFEMVGFLASEVKEARERVRAALRNSGYYLPAKRITVNLSPANIKKTGSAFDLPIAAAILAALGIVPAKSLEALLVVGEIGLNGQVQPVEGILPIVADAKGHGFARCMVPYQNLGEASLIHNIQMIPVRTIAQVVAFLNGRAAPLDSGRTAEDNAASTAEKAQTQSLQIEPDFSQVNGQRLVRRASEIAAAGMHNLLMVGAPGAGKTMIARRIPTILPPMCSEEQLELAKVYSISGMLLHGSHRMDRRPFRSPHHTVTPQGLVGGGTVPKPGEVSLAHKGVLFLDELAEFQKSTLELLRQPMEDKKIQISRLHGSCCYPADFMLVAATNPCPCGAYPDMNRCRCTQSAIDRYLGRISQPLLDRIDLCVEASPLAYADLTKEQHNESSAQIRARVCEAWEVQKERFAGSGIYFNSQIPADRLKEACMLTQKEEEYLQKMYGQLHLTARAYHKVLRVARTVADLSHSRRVDAGHLAEAFCYRSLDWKDWERW